MRPVTLRMDGFAAFREPTEVDFTGAEYFAFVGPTGSGKSTVIDAMTFALYGSVPRWDDRRTVSLALSPTANRGTVRLLFDIGEERYVVARELRRAANGSVTVRNASLEHLSDPTALGDVEDDTHVVAADSIPVTKAVEQLLGLPFEQFCICVVLPQGDFAQFLHAKPADRQKMLTRILGLGMYEVMAREAAGEAKAANQRAEVLAEQLAEYADASEEAAAAAAEREVALTELVDRVSAAVPVLAACDAELRDAERSATRLGEERALLAGLRTPDGLTELATRAGDAHRAVSSARARLAGAEKADDEARRRMSEAPDREPLRQLRRDHAELAEIGALLPRLDAERDEAAGRTASAASAAAEAATALDTARAEQDRAGQTVTELRARSEQLAQERTRLTGLRTPDDVVELDRLRRAGARRQAEVRTEVAEAETADTEARKALAAGPDRFRLTQARRDHAALLDVSTQRDESQRRHRRLREESSAAEVALAEAEHARSVAESALADAARTDLVGALRPRLALHEDCPVCEQRVLTLPAPVEQTDLTAIQEALTRATERRDRAREAHTGAADALHRASAELDALTARIDSLRSGLADGPDTLEQVDELLATADALADAAAEAERRASAARTERDRVETKVDDVASRAASSVARLRAARDPLVVLGAPPIEAEDDLASSWQRLTDWAASAASDRAVQLSDLRAQLTEAERRYGEAEQACAVAARRARELRESETAAIRAEQDALGRAATATRRRAELEKSLAGHPSDAELAEQLAALDELADNARAADVELRAARVALGEDTRTSEAVGALVARGWRELRSHRDAVVALGAPAPEDSASTGDDLVAAWRALVDWAGAAVAGRDEQLAENVRVLERVRARAGDAERALVEDLRSHDIELPPGRAAAQVAASAASAGLEKAKAAGARIAERRTEAAKLGERRAQAQEAGQVARMLAGLLRSDAFPRWLVASALDALVTDASRVLDELSGGQFELTHDEGEFLVVDHADADSRRPVKTLSGGETFQASLALALALSEQLATLASAGAARLDSIFLDEGFGTLDEANLEVVAGTLENLAARGDRMVGVITHVPALAERVPVRFAVSRDQRTSSIVREEMA
ncbi:AAA family ATPase [Pseudonocardia spinosispora]|uniref:AAA family ATPase n=1 Tax=Pseudonocardia spinosispora TaxID=103441 RepID=UPI000491D960|nr:SMC family ATPase [Pseudonocardia spinosispora]